MRTFTIEQANERLDQLTDLLRECGQGWVGRHGILIRNTADELEWDQFFAFIREALQHDNGYDDE